MTISLYILHKNCFLIIFKVFFLGHMFDRNLDLLTKRHYLLCSGKKCPAYVCMPVGLCLYLFSFAALAFKDIDYEYRAVNLVKDGGEQVLFTCCTVTYEFIYCYTPKFHLLRHVTTHYAHHAFSYRKKWYVPCRACCTAYTAQHGAASAMSITHP